MGIKRKYVFIKRLAVFFIIIFMPLLAIFPVRLLFASESIIFITPYVIKIGDSLKIKPGTQKAVYLTGYGSMRNPNKRQQIYEIIDRTELNSIVFDVKDDFGYIDYNCEIEEAVASGAVKNYYNLDEILEEFNDRNIYSIARFVAFKDNVLPRARTDFAILNKNTMNPAVMEGSTWVDIYCRQVWDYYIEIIIDLAKKGVDEVQFDYIRAPSRGNSATAYYPANTGDREKSWAISGFLEEVKFRTAPYDIKIL